jgi:hypothetical protein
MFMSSLVEVAHWFMEVRGSITRIVRKSPSEHPSIRLGFKPIEERIQDIVIV